MTRLFIITLFILSTTYSQAQLNWVYNMKEAQALSLNENKLILLDFWASWCGPCRNMDDKLWGAPEISEVAHKFIPFKVDVDVNQDLAGKYGIKGIPTVILITANGDVVWKKSDFSSAKVYLDFFKTLPEDISVLNEKITPVLMDNKNSQAYLDLGMAYQKTGIQLKNTKLKNAFLKLSNSYFKQANKKDSTGALTGKTALLSILNEAYKGNVKKVRKKLGKMKAASLDKELQELKQFIVAYCYKCEGDKVQLASSKAEITNTQFLAQLE
ncbi:MAG: thioredoxin family protein [Saprospiraceae bacterium]